MADMNKQFREFHEAIAVKRDEEKATLAEKRDIILDKLAAGIKKQREAGVHIPDYTHRNQGSYAMDTGVKPLSGDYDLDVALLFELATKDYPDPVVVKGWVYKALEGHTKEVRVREPCVTVFYSQNGEHIYHVDFAIYANANPDGKCFLARGKTNSVPEKKRWEESDPASLIEAMKSKYSNADDGAQFRRVIRYLKRWKDVNFPSDGRAAPTGIAITACALAWFAVVKRQDYVANRTRYDDQQATVGLVREMLRRFSGVFDADTSTFVERLEVRLPLPPRNDLFERMTAGQMLTLKSRLESLRDALEAASDDPDPHTAAQTLRKALGDDFPVPPKEATGKPRGPATVSSGNSA